MQKIIGTLIGALFVLGLTAGPANATNAYVYNSCVSEGRLGVIADNNGRYLYPCGRTGASTDTVVVPAGYRAYHHYNGRYQRMYGPGAIINLGGVYQHTFFLYRI